MVLKCQVLRCLYIGNAFWAALKVLYSTFLEQKKTSVEKVPVTLLTHMNIYPRVVFIFRRLTFYGSNFLWKNPDILIHRIKRKLKCLKIFLKLFCRILLGADLNFTGGVSYTGILNFGCYDCNDGCYQNGTNQKNIKIGECVMFLPDKDRSLRGTNSTYQEPRNYWHSFPFNSEKTRIVSTDTKPLNMHSPMGKPLPVGCGKND